MVATFNVKDIHGIIPAMVTPMKTDESLDEATLRAHVERLIEAGIHGLFPTGSQGEFYALSTREKERIWCVVVEQCAGRVPVIAGTGVASTLEVQALNNVAAQCGVDAVSIITPFFITPSREELYKHYLQIADKSAIPIFLYNNPGRTQVSLDASLVGQLAQHPMIVGIKDSSGDLTQTMDIIRQTSSTFKVLMGKDSLILAGLICGACGAVAATANVVPKLVLDIYQAHQSGDITRAWAVQKQLLPLRLAFEWGTFPVVIKSALDLIGVGGGPARRPVGSMSNSELNRLRQTLQKMGILQP
jgi:4-hydroxy-tetrahydrodipicolinate synthase